MGSSFIITETQLEKNGRELMLDFYDIIHDDHFLEFEEIKSQRDYYDENAVMEYCKVIERNPNIKGYKLYKYNTLDELDLNKHKVKLSVDEIKTRIKNEIASKKIDLEFVYEFLSEMDKKLNLKSDSEFEIDEDLFCLKKAFLKAYDLFHYSGYNLKD